MGSKQLSPDESRRFVQSIAIDPPQKTRSLEMVGADSKIVSPTYTDEHQAVVIGSQIAEFDAGIPAAMRPLISNSFLLAQLAAKKSMVQSGGGAREWFEKYVDVLTSIGWLGEGIAEAGHEVSGDSLQAHKEIITVLATALGPAAAAASVVLAALNGLKEMTQNSPWITLFDRQSQTKNVQQFQIAYARAADDAQPEVILACFELSASASVTQILFFKFSSSNAKLNHRQARLSMNDDVFDAVKGAVKEKIAAHVSSLISEIDI